MDLAHVVQELLESFHLPVEPLPNERLVRYYVTEGVLTRPEREGREARFGFRQIVEFLATRLLLTDGWSLARIADFLNSANSEALLALLPQPNRKQETELQAPVAASPPARTEAERLVEQFAEPYRRQRPAPVVPPSVVAPPEALQKRLQTRQDIRSAMARLGMQTETPPRSGEVRFTLAPWCYLKIAPELLEETLRGMPDNATQEQLVEDVVRVCRAAIEEEITRRSKRSP